MLDRKANLRGITRGSTCDTCLDLTTRIESSGYESEPITSDRTFVNGYLARLHFDSRSNLDKALEFVDH